MSKPISVQPYDPNWPDKFEIEAGDIKDILKSKCLEVHHIGSTSIPNMSAKQDLDILLIVEDLKDSLELSKHGFNFKGELNIPLRYFFSKNTQRSKINLHVCEKEHGFGPLNLAFRDYLRAHHQEAKIYEETKLKALRNPKAHEKIRWFLSHYGASKDDCIKSILERAGHQGLMVNFCMHNNEWNQYHRIKDEQIFKPIGIEYDPNHPSFSDENHFHFCLYVGSKIVGTAHIEFLSKHIAALRSFCIDTPCQRKGYGTYLITFLEKWLRLHQFKTVHLHANVKATSFYEKLGYKFIPLNDPDGDALSLESKNMEKNLES